MLFSLVIQAGCDRAERRLVGFWPTKRRSVPTAPGVGRTRHPRLGAAGQPSVAVRELSRNQRPTKFPSLQIAGAALSVNLLNTKEQQKPKQLKKNLSRRSPHGPFGYFETFSPDRATPTNDLRPAETGAVFVFCNISTVETSNFTMGLGPKG